MTALLLTLASLLTAAAGACRVLGLVWRGFRRAYH
jgi:hypothetical protein